MVVCAVTSVMLRAAYMHQNNVYKVGRAHRQGKVVDRTRGDSLYLSPNGLCYSIGDSLLLWCSIFFHFMCRTLFGAVNR